MGIRLSTRQMLSRGVRVEQVAEAAIWLLLPYVVIGLLWGGFHPDMVKREQTALQTIVPAGAEIIAYGHVSVLWPVLMLDPGVCPA